MAGHRRAEATPSFGQLCPAMTKETHFQVVRKSPKMLAAFSVRLLEGRPLWQAFPAQVGDRTNHEVRRPADIDVHNPREYRRRTCNGYRPIFLVAWHLPSARHTMAHRSSPSLSGRSPSFPGDDAAIGGRVNGASEAAEQPLQYALFARQMSRLRRAQAQLRQETRSTSDTFWRSWHSPIRKFTEQHSRAR
jgi:hypothetical protein